MLWRALECSSDPGFAGLECVGDEVAEGEGMAHADKRRGGERVKQLYTVHHVIAVAYLLCITTANIKVV